MTKKNYTVLSAVEFDRRYEVGALIALDDEHAAGLLKVRAIEPGDVELVDDEQARQDAIIAAINELDKDNAEAWQKDGKPKLDAIAAIIGNAITAVERNNAWAIINAVA